MIALDLIQICQNGFELVVVERQVLRYQTWSDNEKFFDLLFDGFESLGTFENDVDEAGVMVGVQVGNVDGLQVTKNMESSLAAELTVELQKGSLSTIQKNKIIWKNLN